MKKSNYIFTLVIAAILILSSCSPNTSVVETSVATPSLTSLKSPTPTFTETIEPSLTPTVPPSPTATQMVVAERIPILEYHNPTFKLSDDVMMTPEWFEDQMKYLHDNGYMTLDAEQLADFLNGGEYPQKSVVISFDIGVAHRTEYADIVIPTLRKYGLKAIVFLLANTNLVKDDCTNQGELFCWPELKSWSDEGLFSIQSHGIWHMDYSEADAETQKTDAGLSKQVIESNIGKPVVGFAYPYDSINSQTITILKSLGYKFAAAGYTRNDRSVYRWDNDPYYLPRVYPYSNPDMYPGLSSNNGKTFEELLISQTELVGLATPTPSAIGSPTPANSTEIISTDINDKKSGYMSACNQIDKVADPVERLYQLNHLSFDIDLSIETQALLPAPVKLAPSCNYRVDNNPRAIILHSTRGPLTGAITTFQKKDSTSAHYIIDRDGSVIQLLPESVGAYHVTCYGSRSLCVPSCPICDDADGNFVEPATQSIGIELVNGGTVNDPATFDGPVYEDYAMAFGYRYWEDYTEAQIQSLILLVNDIRSRWNIPLDMVMGHYRINTNTDPGPALNLFWDRYGNPFRKAIFPPDN